MSENKNIPAFTFNKEVTPEQLKQFESLRILNGADLYLELEDGRLIGPLMQVFPEPMPEPDPTVQFTFSLAALPAPAQEPTADQLEEWKLLYG